ncbi:MAG: hypothetical protein CL529_10360 [Aequorivita sp.]|nr:hypothetical protein [Aequorivita sp.]
MLYLIDSNSFKMETAKLKTQIINKVEKADENLLQEINRFINEYEDGEIVAYTVSGKPLTRSDYKKEIQIAEEQIKNGQYISHEDLIEEIKSWKK